MRVLSVNHGPSVPGGVFDEEVEAQGHTLERWAVPDGETPEAGWPATFPEGASTLWPGATTSGLSSSMRSESPSSMRGPKLEVATSASSARSTVLRSSTAPTVIASSAAAV